MIKNFRDPVSYSVTAEDGTQSEYRVVVTQVKAEIIFRGRIGEKIVTIKRPQKIIL